MPIVYARLEAIAMGSVFGATYVLLGLSINRHAWERLNKLPKEEGQ